MSTTQSAVSRIGVVIVPVTDQERAIAFYTQVLGMEQRTDIPMGNDYRWVEVAPAGAETTIAVVLPPPGQKAGGAQTGICLNTRDIEGYHERLREAGVDVDAEISRMGDPVPPMFWFRDPDANTLLVVEAE